MRFVNDLGLPARLFRGEPRPGEMLAVLVLETTHDVEFGELGPVLLEAGAPQASSTPHPLGVIPGSRVPYKPGLDVWVLGHAQAPHEEPTQAMIVRLQVGAQARELLVVGDRRWIDPQLHDSPRPFTRMPLTYDRAFGGVADDGGLGTPFADNPVGRGFVVDPKKAKGVALPNLEWPHQRIRRWDDRPVPAGLAPLAEDAPLHLARALRPRWVEDPSGGPDKPDYTRPELLPGLFSCAHPSLVLDPVPGGTPVSLTGVGPTSRLSFILPHQAFVAVVELGAAVHRLPLKLDTIGIIADEQRVRLVRRASFRYRLVPHQHRRACLALGAVEEAA